MVLWNGVPFLVDDENGRVAKTLQPSSRRAIWGIPISYYVPGRQPLGQALLSMLAEESSLHAEVA